MKTDVVVVGGFGEEAQKQLARVILAARKSGSRGRGRPCDPFVLKDREFVVKELVYLHFEREMTWTKAIGFLRARSDYRNKMKSIKNPSWIVYAWEYKKKLDQAKRLVS